MHAAMIVAAADGAARGVWTDTVGLLFTYGILIPAIVTGLVVVSIVSGRGDKKADEELRSRFTRKLPSSRS